MTTALQLAECVQALRAQPLPAAARESALRCVLDLVCAAAAGFGEPGVAGTRRAASTLFGAGEADLWFTGRRSSPAAALLANSAAAAALDLDDGYREARGHPGAAVIPAAAAALSPASDAESFLAAIVAGYEVGVRVARGLRSYAPSGAWSPFAVIAATGALHGTPDIALANAFAIGAQTAPALPGLAGRMGSDVKEGIPWGSVTGHAAWLMACEGVTGPLGIFDEPALFSAGRITHDLGAAPLIGGTYFKPYACCRHAHAPIEAYRAVAGSHAIPPDEVQALHVATYSGSFNLSNSPRPRTLVQAQYSIPFCVAAAALHGEQALLPMTSELLHHARIHALAERVRLEHDPELEALFPRRSPARVTVVTARGRFVSDVTDPRGDPATPLHWSDLEAKFVTATRHVLAPARQQAMLAAVARLREGELAPLREALLAPNVP